MGILENFIDIHIHTSPDVRLRKLDDLEAARAAASEKMRAIVLKSHVGATADRAVIANKIVDGIEIFGSIVLNDPVGGLNPAAVETAIAMGARVVWMPTISAANHRHFHANMGGICLHAHDVDTCKRLEQIMELIRDHHRVLASGHISCEECFLLMKMANRVGLKKVLITHPEVPWIQMSIAEQIELRDRGAFFERCYASTSAIGGKCSFETISSAIRQVGIETTVLSTDYGAQELDTPCEGYKEYLKKLVHDGFSKAQLERMGSMNPAFLLDLSC